jgi:hypothetical protein
MPKALSMARSLDFTLKRASAHDIKEQLAIMSPTNICANVTAQGTVPGSQNDKGSAAIIPSREGSDNERAIFI